ncbi:MAG: cyclase [Thermoanaerobaculia bacterium]
MPYVLVVHKVQDYDRWRPYFDSDLANQRAAGLTVRHVLRSADDPQEVVVLFEAEDLGRARELAGSEDLRKIMQEAGVLGRPEMHFLDTAGA